MKNRAEFEDFSERFNHYSGFDYPEDDFPVREARDMACGVGYFHIWRDSEKFELNVTRITGDSVESAVVYLTTETGCGISVGHFLFRNYSYVARKLRQKAWEDHLDYSELLTSSGYYRKSVLR